MNQILTKSTDFLKEEDGVTAIEYALIASLIFLAIVTAVATLGNKISNTLYDGIVNEIGSAMGG